MTAGYFRTTSSGFFFHGCENGIPFTSLRALSSSCSEARLIPLPSISQMTPNRTRSSLWVRHHEVGGLQMSASGSIRVSGRERSSERRNSQRRFARDFELCLRKNELAALACGHRELKRSAERARDDVIRRELFLHFVAPKAARICPKFTIRRLSSVGGISPMRSSSGDRVWITSAKSV